MSEGTTGIIEIEFVEGISQDKIQETLNNVYLKNPNIKGMEYKQFDKKKTLIEIHKKIEEWCNKENKNQGGRE